MKDYDKKFTQKMIQNRQCCEVCGKLLVNMQPQLAHRIHKPKGKKKRHSMNLAPEIIDHEFNLALVCSLGCNSKVLIDHKPLRKAELLTRIQDDLNACQK